MPTYQVTDPKTGRTLRLTGDSPPTEQELDQLFSQYQVTPEKTLGEKAAGVGETALTMATGAIAQPISGLYGLANLATGGNAESAAALQQSLSDRLTYKPSTAAGQEYLQAVGEAPIISDIANIIEKGSKNIGDVTYETTGSPLAASIATALPEAVLSAMGAKAPAAAGSRAGDLAIEQARKSAQAAVRGTSTDKAVLAASETAKKLRAGKMRDIAEVINADPAYYKALDELGVTSEPLPSYASRNPQFRGIEQSFAAMPNSPQNAQALQFAKDVSSVAHGLQEKYTRFADKADASIQWRNATLKTIDELGNAADEAYNALSDVIDKRAVANPQKTMDFIKSQTENLALGVDDPDVPDVIKKAMRSLAPRQVVDGDKVVNIPATYENLDMLRRKIGEAAFSNEGEFKDAGKALLKRLYGSLSDDVNAMAEAQGLGEQVKAAKALVSQRKTLETQAQDIIGKRLQNDVVPVIQGGIRGLAKGGVDKYQKLMSSLDPEMRKELVFTAISDQFTKTLKGEKNHFDNTAFLKWYDSTLGNKTVRAIIEKDLPEGSLADLDNLSKISRGISQATAQKIPTGIVNSVLNDQTGFVARLVGVSADVGRRIPVAGQAIDTASSIANLLSKNTDRAAAASDLLSDPRLQSMIRNGVADGIAQGKAASKRVADSQARVMKSKAYQAWAETLSENDKASLASMGLVQFLLQPREQPQK